MASGSAPVKVAVLGGGIAGLTAAYELTRGNLAARHEVTVYQQGWRLGGKGASGRFGPAARIHEHGLHVWFGFYANALALMDECLTERRSVQPPWTHQDLRDAFTPVHELVLTERRTYATSDGGEPGAERYESVCLPLPASEVGEPFFARLPRYVILGLRYAAMALRDDGDGLATQAWGVGGEEAAERTAVALDLAEQQALLPAGDPELYGQIAGTLEEAAPAYAGADVRGRTLRQLGFFWGAMLRGLAEDVLPQLPWKRSGAAHPFDVLNGKELRQWLAQRGRLEEFGEAPFMNSLYDLVFAYPRGSSDRGGEIAAGVAAENILSMLARSRGSLMLKMRGAMGDVIFAPLYEVLRARGVRFRFFHTVTRLRLDAHDDRIEQIELVRQVELAGTTFRPVHGRYEQDGPGYDPLEDYGDIRAGLRGWPAAPREDELSRRSREQIAGKGRPVDLEREADPIAGARVALQRGSDFDRVVLAIPVGALGWEAAEHPAGWPEESVTAAGYGGPCQELMARSEPFRDMVLGARPVMTQSFQVWLDRDRDDVGWPCRHTWSRRWRGTRAEAILGNAPHPFETLCDMSHLLHLERWGSLGAPRQLAYLCGVLDEDTVGGSWRDADMVVHSNALRWLQAHHGRPEKPFWQSFTPDDLHHIGGPPGWGRFDEQHWRANAARSERYSAPFKDAVRTRLAPGDSCFADLVLAGDWTRTQVNAGCVEAAVMSGMLAAAALAGPAGRLPRLPRWRSDRRSL